MAAENMNLVTQASDLLWAPLYKCSKKINKSEGSYIYQIKVDSIRFWNVKIEVPAVFRTFMIFF